MDISKFRVDRSNREYDPKKGDSVQLDEDGYFVAIVSAIPNPKKKDDWLLLGDCIMPNVLPDLSKPYTAFKYLGNDKWSETIDYRKAVLYDKETHLVLNALDIPLGKTPEELGATLKKPADPSMIFKDDEWIYDIDRMKAIAASKLAKYRWERQNDVMLTVNVSTLVGDGDTYAGDVVFKAGDATMNRLSVLVSSMAATDTVKFIDQSKVYDLNYAQLKYMLYQASEYNQACFTTEAAHLAKINAEKHVSFVLTYDVSTDWPSTVLKDS